MQEFLLLEETSSEPFHLESLIWVLGNTKLNNSLDLRELMQWKGSFTSSQVLGLLCANAELTFCPSQKALVNTELYPSCVRKES